MDAHSLSRFLHKALLSEFECSPALREGVRVRTPMLLPDRDLVDVFVIERNGKFVVTDYGDTLGWMGVQSVRSKPPKAQVAMIQHVCRSLGLVMDHGELMVKDVPFDRLPDAVFRVAQGVVRVADSAYAARIRTAPSTADHISALLSGIHLTFHRNVQRKGASGRIWKVDFETHTSNCTGLVYVLSTTSHAAGGRMVRNLVNAVPDIRKCESRGTPLAFAAVFNDFTNVWVDEDYLRISNYAEVVRWSKPDAREHLLHAIGAGRG